MEPFGGGCPPFGRCLILLELSMHETVKEGRGVRRLNWPTDDCDDWGPTSQLIANLSCDAGRQV